MNRSLTEQMQDFSSSLQKAMAEHMHNTMKLQVDMLRAVHNPVGDRVQSIASSMQNIFLEQIKLLSTGMTNPLSNQGGDFSASVQRIMSEQMQIFAASTANPTPEQLEEFFATMRATMSEQVRLAADLQGAMAKQMQQLMDNLHTTMTNLAGSSEEGIEQDDEK
jgi:hypothetical protein